jgi:hypothetical protein
LGEEEHGGLVNAEGGKIERFSEPGDFRSRFFA